MSRLTDAEIDTMIANHKDELEAAYEAGYEKAQQHENIQPMLGEDNGFDEWYERNIANPPERWDEHHD